MTTSNNRSNMAASEYYSSYICIKCVQAHLKYTFTIIGVIDNHPSLQYVCSKPIK